MPWWDTIPRMAFFNESFPREERIDPLSRDELEDHLDRAFNGELTFQNLVEIITRASRDQAAAFRRVASQIRDRNRGHVLTYSRNVFVPITRLCRNACFYCTFRRPSVPRGKEFLTEREVLAILERAKRQKVTEVLFTNGERAEEKYEGAREWLRQHGFESTIDYLHHLGEKCLDMGLLPHVNAGALHEDELKRLKEVCASMGLMLENVSVRLTRKGEVHQAAPDKHPSHRLRTHHLAGIHRVPWTTGILIGIGETAEEVARSLHVLRQLHLKHGKFIQEVIIQNFQPKSGTVMRNVPPPDPEYVMFVVALARCYLPWDVGIQVPPNLNRGHEEQFIHSGICDWGGVSPMTPDYVNPEKPWPRERELLLLSRQHGFHLRRRLPVYPQHVTSKWLSDKVWETIKRFNLATSDGYAS